jgi:hypothetical protein
MNETPSVPSEHPQSRQTRPTSEAASVTSTAERDDAQLLMILTQEHASLLATRSLTWTESFARAALFLSVLSASVIVLGLVGPATGFGPEFVGFALVILPVALFVGVATYVRIDQGNREDISWVVGMNRVRQGYVQIRPTAAPFLMAGTTDDRPGIMRSMGLFADEGYSVGHFFVTIPGMIAVIDAVLAGAIAGIAGSLAGISMAGLIAFAVLVGLAFGLYLGRLSQQLMERMLASYVPAFPSDIAAGEPS